MWLGKLFHGRSAKVEAEWSVFQAQSLPVFVLFFPLCSFSERDQNNGIQLRLQRYLVSFVEGRPKSHWTFFFCLFKRKSVKKWCKKSATPNLKKNCLIFPDRQNFANLQRSPMSCLGDLQILANQITGSCFLTIKLSLYARHIKIIFKREKYLVVR